MVCRRSLKKRKQKFRDEKCFKWTNCCWNLEQRLASTRQEEWRSYQSLVGRWMTATCYLSVVAPPGCDVNVARVIRHRRPRSVQVRRTLSWAGYRERRGGQRRVDEGAGGDDAMYLRLETTAAARLLTLELFGILVQMMPAPGGTVECMSQPRVGSVSVRHCNT